MADDPRVPAESRQARYAADHAQMFLAADGSMMCEKHPGYEWGLCPGGTDCIGPGMPWALRGRTLIEETIRSAIGRAVSFTPKVPTVATTFLDVARSAENVRAQIAAAETLAEAFALYEQLRNVSQLVIGLTDDAAERCEQLLGRM